MQPIIVSWLCRPMAVQAQHGIMEVSWYGTSPQAAPPDAIVWMLLYTPVKGPRSKAAASIALSYHQCKVSKLCKSTTHFTPQRWCYYRTGLVVPLCLQQSPAPLGERPVVANSHDGCLTEATPADMGQIHTRLSTARSVRSCCVLVPNAIVVC